MVAHSGPFNNLTQAALAYTAEVEQKMKSIHVITNLPRGAIKEELAKFPGDIDQFLSEVMEIGPFSHRLIRLGRIYQEGAIEIEEADSIEVDEFDIEVE